MKFLTEFEYLRFTDSLALNSIACSYSSGSNIPMDINYTGIFDW